MTTRAPTALERAIGLLDPTPADPDTSRGFVDLLGDGGPKPRTPAQRLMNTRFVPAIYERLWRPIGVRLGMGMTALSTEDEYELTRQLLDLSGGERVLDVACGPGNFVRQLVPDVGEDGLVVGIDASVTMLERAVADTADGDAAPSAAYVRGDAERLPFRDASFEAVCCYAAMYMFEHPFAVLDEMTRVLAPGGLLAIMASCHRGPDALKGVTNLYTRPGGLRVFGRDELTRALTVRGYTDLSQRVAGFAQFVGGTKE